jgi:hypothetical protein
MTIIETLEMFGHAQLTNVQHAAAWLVGKVAWGEASLQTLEKTSPLVALAMAAGEASATAHGVPIVAIEGLAGEVLAMAKELAAGLAGPPPVTAAYVTLSEAVAAEPAPGPLTRGVAA